MSEVRNEAAMTPPTNIIRGPWTVQQQRANRTIAQFNARARSASIELAKYYATKTTKTTKETCHAVL